MWPLKIKLRISSDFLMGQSHTTIQEINKAKNLTSCMSKKKSIANSDQLNSLLDVI